MAHAHYMLDTYGYKYTFRIAILTPFPLQQWFHERASVFSYKRIACLYLHNTYVKVKQYHYKPG